MSARYVNYLLLLRELPRCSGRKRKPKNAGHAWPPFLRGLLKKRKYWLHGARARPLERWGESWRDREFQKQSSRVGSFPFTMILWRWTRSINPTQRNTHKLWNGWTTQLHINITIENSSYCTCTIILGKNLRKTLRDRSDRQTLTRHSPPPGF